METHRIIGQYEQSSTGPLFIAIGGIHGNEQSGVIALRRVFEKLTEQQIPFRGQALGIAGNLAALKANKRFIDVDLNRQWRTEHLKFILEKSLEDLSITEEREQKELLSLFHEIIDQSENRPIIMMDLHSTSSTGGCFTFPLEDTLSKDLALFLEQPVIHGLESTMKGTTLNYFSDMNFSGFAFEAGQHDEAKTTDRMEAAVWFTMEKLAMLDKIPEAPRAEFLELLRSEGPDLPKEVSLRYRHSIVQADKFKMNPGYKNFQKISSGEILAQDKNGDVKANQNGLILMPLYQEQGEDGFFIVA